MPAPWRRASLSQPGIAVRIKGYSGGVKSLGIIRRFGRTALSLNWIGATPGNESNHWRRAAVVSLSHSF